jgi:hypothetical protein
MTALGTILVTIAYDIPIFTLSYNPHAIAVIFSFGWVFMVTGFSLVLYSRLYIILPKPKLLRALLFVIVGGDFLLHIPIIVSEFLLASDYPISYTLHKCLRYVDVIYSLEEVLLSSLYIYLYVRFVHMGGSEGVEHGYLKKTLYFLILAEVVVVVSDIAVSVVLIRGLYLAHRMILPFVCIFQLRVEFVVLNRLASLGRIPGQLAGFEAGEPTLSDLSRSSTRRPVSLAHISVLPDSSQHCEESLLPPLTVPTLTESGRQSTISGDTMVSFTPGSWRIVGEPRRVDRNSIEELERRYLGRFGTDGVV